MRFAIAALMTLFLVGTIVAQDATQPTASSDTTSTQTSPATTPTAAPADQPAPAAEATAPAADAAAAPTPAEGAAPQAPAQPKSAFGFAGGVTLGSDVLLTEAITPENPTGSRTWTRLGFEPDLSFGKIGVGFDLTIHFLLYPDPNTAFTIYPGDWVPNYQGNGKNILDIYLPKIMYVRYGLKGSDPFFAKLGSVDDLSLGDGFIMSDYSNKHFLPQQRIFGLDLGLDGSMFNFPYAGIEVLTGNLARLDVDGARIFARPLIGTQIPILKNMQVGGTIVVDTQPDLYVPTATPAKTIAAYGADIMVPILTSQAFPLAAFTDIAVDPNQTLGWMIGAGGRLIGVFTYGAQLRVLQDGFIPSYFDADYDLFRAQKFDAMQLPTTSGINTGWLATLGTSLLSDKFAFSIALDGPFAMAGVTTVQNPDQTKYPHLRSVLRLDQIGTFPVYFDASYEKFDIGAINGFLPDLVDPTNAVIGLNVNYKTGASVLTLAYDAKWNPAASRFDVTSSLQASMKF